MADHLAELNAKTNIRNRLSQNIVICQMTIFCLSLQLVQIIDPLNHAVTKLILRRSHNSQLGGFVLICLDEIDDVKNISIEFVRQTLEKKEVSFTYILVPFSDPGGYQEVVSNNNSEDVIQKWVGLPMAWIAQFTFS